MHRIRHGSLSVVLPFAAGCVLAIAGFVVRISAQSKAPPKASKIGKKTTTELPLHFEAIKSKGKVEVRPAPDEQWSKIVLHKPYPLGAWIRTGRNSFVVIQLSNENRFRVLARTRVAVTADIRNPRVRKLQLARGKVEVQLDRFPPGYRFQVETPTAVCGALGTRYDVAYVETTHPAPGFFARIFGRRVREPEHQIACSRGHVYLDSPALEISDIRAGNRINATIHAGLENSFARVVASDGSAEVRITGGNSVRLGKGAVIESAHERGLTAGLAAVRVSGDVVIPGGEELPSGAIVLKNGAPYRTQGVSDYLAAARDEGRIATELAELQQAETADQNRIQALQTELRKAAERATRLRHQLERRNMQRIIRQIRRMRPAPIRR